ncbi:fimbria/pilus periplasmic chaperone [Kluyvera genomosp. 1]|uniref:fimbria/pilus periplasmic chaperone n=1 Tax=Kluyvera genomosp. 1 TaxID=2774053 RepID=UPI000691FA59|nr:fimbria/pilus periplasmic chaperone [Kluyvera genomosp. 1]
MKSAALYARHVRYVIGFIIGLMLIPSAYASVTMLGSRVIYPSTASSVDVQLKNNDDFPYVIQTWFDDGDVDAGPNQASAIPFVATPPVFRIQAKNGQVVRIAATGNKKLPQDRESVYWFNILQIPPSNLEGTEKKNKMLVMLRTRVKLFYRPAAISAPVEQLKKLQVKLVWNSRQGLGVEIANPQPWFASVTDIALTLGGQKRALHADMVSPFSQRTFWFSAIKNRPNSGGTVSLTVVNDQGSRISEHYDVTLP